MGEVVGIEISSETAINANRRIEANHWGNVRVVEEDAKTVRLTGMFDGFVLFAAPDLYASPEAVTNLTSYLRDDARVAVFGAKLSNHALGVVLNPIFRSLMKLSFSSTPALDHEPWSVLKERCGDFRVEEHFWGCMFLARGTIRNRR
jgi:hypothetical protein